VDGASLEARVLDAFASSGSSASTDDVRHAARVVRLLLQVTVRGSEELAARRPALLQALAVRTSLDEAQRRTLLDIAAAPEFRAHVEPIEQDAFTSRFGTAAARLLREADEAELDLSGYARAHGSGAALLLLDACFAIFAADGAIEANELRQLEAAATELGVDGVLLSALHARHDPRHAAGTLRFPLRAERIRIGRSAGSDVVLPDPQVASLHCELIRNGASWRVVDAESGRPTVVNGRPVSSAPLDAGDDLRVGPYRLRLDGDALQAWGERSFTALSVQNLKRTIGSVSLLDDVSFTVFSGEVIAMVGPSGCGKTTLLNAIAGITPADTGNVRMDGQPFHALLASDQSRIGVVPQDDIVHPELTVEESLFYSGRLRFSPDTSEAEVRREVDRVLEELGIAHIRASRIGDALRRGISGGQRKRVNLGQEMLTRSTRVLFLDEPTSGLDPRAAHDIVRLVRQLADRGRIVFLVTHDLSPQVMAQVDHLLVLAPGGRVAFFGPPNEATSYFRVPTADAIFNRFSDRTPPEWGAAYRSSGAFTKYVATREELVRVQPAAHTPPVAAPATPRVRTPHHLRTLIARYARVKSRDRTGLWVLAAQPPFLALVMAAVFPKPTTSMLFMLSLSCLWFGMSGSVRELISDGVVWKRERRVGVRSTAYVGSKAVVLGAIVVLQCTFLALMTWAIHGLGADPYSFGAAQLVGVASLTGLTGMALGLLVSASFASSEAAVGTLPLLLIPQITLSTLLVGVRNMTPFASWLTWLNPQRYAFDATLKVGEKVDKMSRVPGQWDVTSIPGELYVLGLKGASADDVGVRLPALCAALVLFSLVFGLGAWGLVARRTDD
jgi:ABC-type multidrug transport system ATPase subunit